VLFESDHFTRETLHVTVVFALRVRTLRLGASSTRKAICTGVILSGNAGNTKVCLICWGEVVVGAVPGVWERHRSHGSGAL